MLLPPSPPTTVQCVTHLTLRKPKMIRQLVLPIPFSQPGTAELCGALLEIFLQKPQSFKPVTLETCAM